MHPPATLPYEVFDAQQIDDGSGTLYVAELGRRLGGAFSRIYFITGVPHGAVRGGHAHKRQDELLICVQGSVVVRIEGHGHVAAVPLERPGRLLYLSPGCWRDLIDFSSDAVVGVLSRAPFDEDDYIRDRAAFRAWQGGTA